MSAPGFETPEFKAFDTFMTKLSWSIAGVAAVMVCVFYFYG